MDEIEELEASGIFSEISSLEWVLTSSRTHNSFVKLGTAI